jgi:hypothetical protein
MSFNLGDLNPVRILAGKGEIGKTGLGSALATLALDYFAPGLGSLETAGIVGGGTALASGSLQKGLMAGIGAYGAQELAGAAEKGISDAAAQRALDVQNNLAEIGNTYGDINAVNPSTSLTAGEQFKAGLSGLKAMPPKELLQYGAMAAAPVLMAQNKTGLPSNPTNPNAYIRPKTYDPVSHRYYDLPAIKADEMGSQSIADYVNSQVAPAQAARGGLMAAYAGGGFATVGSDGTGVNPNPNPASGPAGQLAYNNEPVMRMAGGGIAHFDDGGPAFSNQQISDYVSNIQAQGGGDKEIAAAMDKYGVNTGQLASALGMNAADVQSRYNAADTTGGYYTGASGISNNQIKNYLGQNPTASDATIYNAMQQYGVTPQQMAYATGNPLAGENNIQDRYNLAGALTQATGQGGNLYGEAVGHSPNALDPQAVAWMDSHVDASGKVDPITVQEVARITGMPVADVQYRYDLVKNAKAPVVKVAPSGGVSTTGPATTTQTVLPTNPQTNAPAGTTNPYGNINNPGDITRNADGTITVQPNIPGRPYGGFSGMDELTKAYTAGGGHLGQILAPSKTYQNTGGSKSAYDYLSGQGTWAGTKTQPAVKAKNTYSNFNAPTADEIKQFSKYAKVYKDGVPVDNPYYGKGTDSSLTTTPATNTPQPSTGDANGGLMSAMASGGQAHYNLGGYSDGGRLLRGPGDGVSDSIPATIANKQPARLADGEFVVPARIVSEIGNGSTEAGARKLYAMMDRVQSARSKTVGKGKIAKNTRADKYLPA